MLCDEQQRDLETHQTNKKNNQHTNTAIATNIISGRQSVCALKPVLHDCDTMISMPLTKKRRG
eukprot:m.390751 g.390751  ORF g.390751 m.390751 type:complete len:63 (+) comp209699_c0_seq1:34-222(+)